MSRGDSIPADRTISITRMIDAPRPLVFKAWTEPGQIDRWWGPKGFVTIDHDMDIRPGGAYRFRMRSPAGTEHRKRGVYREIVEPERIVFTFAWEQPDGRVGPETLLTVTFEEVGGKTRLTLRQGVFDSAETRHSHASGWTSCLERFAEYMASI